MQHSIHTARWVDMMSDLDYDLHMFAIDPAPPHNKLRGVTLHVPFSTKPAPRALVPGARKRVLDLMRTISHPVDLVRRVKANSRAAIRAEEDPGRQRCKSSNIECESANIVTVPLRVPEVPNRPLLRINERLGRPNESDQTAPWPHVPEALAALITTLEPDLIHSMEFQHAAYLVLAARDRLEGRMSKWLATNWGSDIFYFGRMPGHAHQIRRVCEAIDLYSCECHRDVGLAREFGYKGPALPVLPNSGGIDVARVQLLRDVKPPSKRKMIMVKGYDHFVGRAMVSLSVLERFSDLLKDYVIILFSVGTRPRARAIELAASGILNIRVIDLATHDEILRYFGRSRLYLGVSISDAISTSVLEAMAMGAFPIQTDTSCCEEWFIPGESGFAVPPDDFETICGRFRQALTDDELVDNAAIRNFEIIESRLDISVVRPQVADFYRQALHG